MLPLRLTNLFGGKALHIGTVHVAEAGENGASLPTPIILSPSRASGSEEGMQARLGAPTRFRTEGSSWPSAFPK
jgi:hypothetical protein